MFFAFYHLKWIIDNLYKQKSQWYWVILIIKWHLDFLWNFQKTFCFLSQIELFWWEKQIEKLYKINPHWVSPHDTKIYIKIQSNDNLAVVQYNSFRLHTYKHQWNKIIFDASKSCNKWLKDSFWFLTKDYNFLTAFIGDILSRIDNN